MIREIGARRKTWDLPSMVPSMTFVPTSHRTASTFSTPTTKTSSGLGLKRLKRWSENNPPLSLPINRDRLSLEGRLVVWWGIRELNNIFSAKVFTYDFHAGPPGGACVGTGLNLLYRESNLST